MKTRKWAQVVISGIFSSWSKNSFSWKSLNLENENIKQEAKKNYKLWWILKSRHTLFEKPTPDQLNSSRILEKREKRRNMKGIELLLIWNFSVSFFMNFTHKNQMCISLSNISWITISLISFNGQTTWLYLIVINL